jgi:hypothetical protein
MLRHRWTWRLARSRGGRPRTDAAIRALVSEMAAANLYPGSSTDSFFAVSTHRSHPLIVVALRHHRRRSTRELLLAIIFAALF